LTRSNQLNKKQLGKQEAISETRSNQIENKKQSVNKKEAIKQSKRIKKEKIRKNFILNLLEINKQQ